MGMEAVYASWREELPRYFYMGREAAGSSDASKIMVCGMGGSGAAGDYLEVLTGGGMISVKSNEPPRGILELIDGFIAVSYSGNTWETLECARKSVSHGVKPILFIASGGRLARDAEDLGVPLVKLPQGILPRASFGHMLGALLGVAVALGMLDLSEREVRSIAGRALDPINAEAWAFQWAPRLASASFLAVAGCGATVPLAVRAKNELAENSKLPARLEVYPESAHNDIEAPADGYIHFRPSKGSCKSVMEAVERVRREEGGCVAVFTIETGDVSSLLEDMLSATFKVGLASIKIAAIRGYSPEPTPRIVKYKRALEGGFGTR